MTPPTLRRAGVPAPPRGGVDGPAHGDLVFRGILLAVLIAYAGISAALMFGEPSPATAEVQVAHLDQLLIRAVIRPPEGNQMEPPTSRLRPPEASPEAEKSKPEPEAESPAPEAEASPPGNAGPSPGDKAPPKPRDVRKMGVLAARSGPSGGAASIGSARKRRLKALHGASVVTGRSAPGQAGVQVGRRRETGGVEGLIAKAGSGPTGSGANLGGVQGVAIEAGVGQISGADGAPAARTDGAIREVVARWAKNFQYCYERSLKLDPGMRGRVWLDFSIAAEGSVSRIDISSGDMDVSAGGLAACLERFFNKMKFPPASGGVECRYPLMLIPE